VRAADRSCGGSCPGLLQPCFGPLSTISAPLEKFAKHKKILTLENFLALARSTRTGAPPPLGQPHGARGALRAMRRPGPGGSPPIPVPGAGAQGGRMQAYVVIDISADLKTTVGWMRQSALWHNSAHRPLPPLSLFHKRSDFTPFANTQNVFETAPGDRGQPTSDASALISIGELSQGQLSMLLRAARS